MAEWSKAHAWKVCVRASVPGVRIPCSPPFFFPKINNLIPIQLKSLQDLELFFAQATIVSMMGQGKFKEYSMKILLVFLVLGTLFSCGGAPDKGRAIDESLLSDKQRSFLNELNQNLGGQHKSSGIIVKTDTEMGGEWIIIEHFVTGNTAIKPTESKFVAYNLADYEAGKYSVWSGKAVYSKLRLGEILDLEDIGSNRFEGKYGSYCGLGEFSCTTVTFEDSTSIEKDLEKIGSKIEVNSLKDQLLDYGFSDNKSIKIVRLANAFKSISSKRALTSREKDIFTKELTGLSFDKASSILVNEGYDALVEKASIVNGADPEAIKELINEVL